jgi:hypothetical protein
VVPAGKWLAGIFGETGHGREREAERGRQVGAQRQRRAEAVPETASRG